MNYILQSYAGNTFQDVARKAKNIAILKDITVEFDFNDRKCLVNKNTNLDWLWRDYHNSFEMEWKTVGADCLPKYTPEIQAELERRRKASEERAELHRKEQQAKDNAEKEEFDKKVKGIELELLNPEDWQKSRDANTDGYGKAALDYAEGWAKLMQIEIAKGKTIAEAYDSTQYGLGFLGITGFQFGCAVSILARTWKYGEELRKIHNKKYGVSEDKQGTVNPAILTMGKA